MLASTICDPHVHPQPVLGITVKKEMEFKYCKFIDCLKLRKQISFKVHHTSQRVWSGLLLGRNENKAWGNFGVKMLPRIATVNAL
jgi:hypothetical protein